MLSSKPLLADRLPAGPVALLVGASVVSIGLVDTGADGSAFSSGVVAVTLCFFVDVASVFSVVCWSSIANVLSPAVIPSSAVSLASGEMFVKMNPGLYAGDVGAMVIQW